MTTITMLLGRLMMLIRKAFFTVCLIVFSNLDNTGKIYSPVSTKKIVTTPRTIFIIFAALPSIISVTTSQSRTSTMISASITTHMIVACLKFSLKDLK